jgi:hypothetical protein
MQIVSSRNDGSVTRTDCPFWCGNADGPRRKRVRGDQRIAYAGRRNSSSSHVLPSVSLRGHLRGRFTGSSGLRSPMKPWTWQNHSNGIRNTSHDPPPASCPVGLGVSPAMRTGPPNKAGAPRRIPRMGNSSPRFYDVGGGCLSVISSATTRFSAGARGRVTNSISADTNVASSCSTRKHRSSALLASRRSFGDPAPEAGGL